MLSQEFLKDLGVKAGPAKEAFQPRLAESLLRGAIQKHSKRLTKECMEWARQYRPEILSVIKLAEKSFNAAYMAENMSGCRKAVEDYERALTVLGNSYQSYCESGQETTSLLENTTVWNLPPEKAELLDRVFNDSSPVVEAGGHKWYSLKAKQE